MKKFITVLLAVAFFMGFTATASAQAITFSENVTFDHVHAVTSWVYDCPESLNYTFLSESIALPQFDPSLGVLTSVELVVESSIDVVKHTTFMSMIRLTQASIGIATWLRV